MCTLDDQFESGEDILREPYRLIPALLDAANLHYFLIAMSVDGTIQFTTDSVEKVLGRDPIEIVGKKFNVILSANYDSQMIRSGLEATDMGKPAEYCCELLTASQVPISVKMFSLGVYEDETLVGMVSLVQPVSDLKSNGDRDSRADARARARELTAQLSKAEHEVVQLVVDGHMNKAMAKMLGVAVRTIEARRARAMMKLQARTLPDLVKIWLLASE